MFDRKFVQNILFFVQKIKIPADISVETSAGIFQFSRREQKLFRLLSDVSQNTTVYVKHMTIYKI